MSFRKVFSTTSFTGPWYLWTVGLLTLELTTLLVCLSTLRQPVLSTLSPLPLVTAQAMLVSAAAWPYYTGRKSDDGLMKAQRMVNDSTQLFFSFLASNLIMVFATSISITTSATGILDVPVFTHILLYLTVLTASRSRTMSIPASSTPNSREAREARLRRRSTQDSAGPLCSSPTSSGPHCGSDAVADTDFQPGHNVELGSHHVVAQEVV
ncbi:hypothetical protein FALBO_9764 [Fusarium albosuccineum]|uniref:Uncharacterized protein n=1 Tax=Fusarium albosuccineum TaxID=1237068 RepID=A0A8H4L979_9HYPO|nr:hypothetical protein FALBO_9764 [Fusarium albosuccineum]